jgi:hypothetical protein
MANSMAQVDFLVNGEYEPAHVSNDHRPSRNSGDTIK